ncbi:unnamed protein product [Nippostrongylus brasiliensis]|uniref:Cellulase n=1 Tax=Nippostrongylus brasiliensis TaxID=27835 RepID=A0A0N4XK20_NIPBR|nr:unnamed protein product [Nippostrongylus brasiliensis]
MDKSISNNRRGTTLENYKLHLARTALNWYEKKLGVSVEEPMMRDSKWNLWGGVYYAASLYTTIGRIRRVGSEMSLRSMSTAPLLNVHRTTSNLVNTTDHQIESNKPLGELDVVLPDEEQAETVPMKAALIFFFLWISLSAFIVRYEV